MAMKVSLYTLFPDPDNQAENFRLLACGWVNYDNVQDVLSHIRNQDWITVDLSVTGDGAVPFHLKCSRVDSVLAEG